MITPIILEAKPLKERWEIGNENLPHPHLAHEFPKIVVYPFMLKTKLDFLMCVAEHKDAAQEVIAFPKEILIDNLKFYNVIKKEGEEKNGNNKGK